MNWLLNWLAQWFPWLQPTPATDPLAAWLAIADQCRAHFGG